MNTCLRASLLIAVLSGCAEEEFIEVPTDEDDYDICADPTGYQVRSQQELEAYLACEHLEPIRLAIYRGIESLAPLRQMTSLGTLSFDFSRELSLDGLENVRSIDTLVLNDTSFTKFELPSLRHVKTLRVLGNSRLTSIALPALTVAEEIEATGNVVLYEISIPNCRMDGDFATMAFDDNPALEVVHAPVLDRLGKLSITKSGFVDLSSFSALRVMRRLDDFESTPDAIFRFGLTLDSNPKLESLAGLENLTTIQNSLSIGGNAQLATLDGLSGLKAFTGLSPGARMFGIERNAKLPYCLVDEFADRLGLGCYNCASNGIGIECPR